MFANIHFDYIILYTFLIVPIYTIVLIFSYFNAKYKAEQLKMKM